MTTFQTRTRVPTTMTKTAPEPTPALIRAVLAEAGPSHVVLSLPSSDYRVQLDVQTPVSTTPGKRIVGGARAQARRIDVVSTGGRFIDPVYGRPRRIQGTILAVDVAADTVTICPHDAFPVVCRTNEEQRAAQFKPGQLVACDLAPGGVFTPNA